MLQWRSAYSVGLVAIVLSACSPAMREWWTEDLRDPRPVVVWNQPAPYVVPTQSGANREADVRPVVPPASGNTGRTVARSAVPPEPRVRAPAAAYAKTAPPPIGAAPARQTRPAPIVRAPAREPVDVPPPAQTATLPLPALVLPEAAPVEMPIVPAEVVSVAGMSEAEVRRLLGAPRSQADKDSRKVWTYAGEGCSVEVIFFLDVTRNSYAALDHKTLAADGRTRSSQPCLQSNASLSRNAP